ncbi:MAG: ComEC family competence protein, partial [Pseudorhodoplanes sp.]|nr:ComEC family competence protein [Pseudorhodoplanes sp.]
GPGRLMPWIPVAFGCGLAGYFAAEREPMLWAPLAVFGIAVCSAVLTRLRPVAFAASLAIAAGAAGFAVATAKSARIAHDILQFPVSGVTLAGFVESREERERSDRIVLAVHRMQHLRLDAKLERVRVSVRKKTAPPVGAFVSLTARLSPPLQPLRPGGYDFARDLYFQGIAATGFVLGAIRFAEPPAEPGWRLRYAATVAAMRDGIDARIRSVVPGDAGAIASALITGKRDAISAPVNEAMYVSSLAHILSISGYHMALVAGVVFFAIRAVLALFPALASRHPIKKWAALAALSAAALYLLLSGAEVATQRAFIMTAMVLVGMMADRPALTLRTIAIAAFAVMLVSPEAIVHPSFQMSFAATLALVAVYERGLPWFSAVPETKLATRIALWGGREIAALVVASLIAGLATTLYAAYHFHRLAPYGVIANLLAMPIVSLWVMPAGMLALVAAPFGFDGVFWRLMGEGVEWMVAVASLVSSLPGAVGRIAAFGLGPVLLGTAGILLLCLLRSPLRFGGIAALLAAVALAATAPQPDVIVASDGRIVALRTQEGPLSLMQGRSDAFVIRDWLAADGDASPPQDAVLKEKVLCDPAGCVGRLADGRAVALALTAEALAEDCVRAAVIVTPREAPPGCGGVVIDRDLLRLHGAVSLTQTGASSFALRGARAPAERRPWTPRLRGSGATPGQAQTPPDATPQPGDLEADER